MFALFAPRVGDNGWLVIPIAQSDKRPLTTGWEAYNRPAPTADEICSWCSKYPDAGIGLAYPITFSAIVALVRIGLSDAEIITNVVVPYLACFDRKFRPARLQAIISGLCWACTTGLDKDAISKILGSRQIFAHWRAR
jgi:hypothetical protein